MLVIKHPTPDSSELEFVTRALEQGALVVLPTDTVYGLAALASDEAAVAKMYAAKGRRPEQPTAVICASIDQLRTTFPELSNRASWAVAALLPGPWTLIVHNPHGTFPWLTGGVPGPIGLRVPGGALELPPVAATSANVAGSEPATSPADIDPALIEHIACAVDRGSFPTATASTILDLTAWEADTGDVIVVRDEAGRAAQAIAVLSTSP